MKATVLIDLALVIKDGKYTVIAKVYEVKENKKFPSGIKAKFVLQDIEIGFARLLVDNHEPHGFHMHTKLPEEPEHREPMDVNNDHEEAYRLFMEEVERIIKNEEE